MKFELAIFGRDPGKPEKFRSENEDSGLYIKEFSANGGMNQG
jgi:hypothetical protein